MVAPEGAEPADRGGSLPRPLLVLLVAMAVALLQIRLGLGADGFLRTGAMADPDSWTRLLRVMDLWETGAWFAGPLPALGPAPGLSLHWTRPLDLLILAPAGLLRAALDLPMRDAVLLAGAAVSPVLHATSALAACWAAAALWARLGPLVAGLLVALHPVALGYGAFGRADHHMLILLAGMLALGAALRAAAPARAGVAWGAGGAAAAGVWVSPEALLFAAPILAGFGGAWVAEGRPGWPGHGMAAQGLRASLGFALVVALALVVEAPPAGWLTGDYDNVSAQHLLMGLLAAAVFALARPLRPGMVRRGLAGLALAGAALAVLLALRPGALAGSLSGADAAAVALFLPLVAEMQPLAGRLEVVAYLGSALAAPVALILGWPRWRRQGQLALALPLGLCLLACLGAGLLHRRFVLDLVAPAAILAAGLPVLALGAGRQALLGFGAVALLVAPAPLAGRLLPAPAEGAVGCEAPAVLAALAAAVPPGAPRPLLLADDVNAGPALAWGAPVRPVAAPYHRGGAAIADMARFFAAPEAAAAQAIARRIGAGLVLACPGQAAAPGSLGARLRQGEIPDWLEPLPGGVPLWRVRPG